MNNMTCIEFRRLVGADPECRDDAVLAHAGECAGCAGFREEMRGFDRQLREALRVPVPEDLESRVRLGAAFRRKPRANWVAMAASLVLAVGVVVALTLNGSSQSLGSAVLAHMYHEPGLLVETDRRIDREKIARVLARVGFEFRGEALEGVSHAGLCYFRGRLVSHMVVSGQQGPVTVLVLPDITTESATEFEEDGFRGTIVPLERGSIAIVGSEGESLDSIRRRLAGRIARTG